MQIYTPGSEIGVLQPWPFDNPESNYKILSGAPAASGRIDTGGGLYNPLGHLALQHRCL
jgi:hypothetical protein